MRPIPTIGDPERYIDSAFVDSAFIELKSCDLWDVKMLYPIREFDTLKSKKVPQSLEIGLFFCQIFIFII